MVRTIFLLILSVVLTACVSGSQDEVLQSAVSSPQVQNPQPGNASQFPNLADRYSYAFDQPNVQNIYRPRENKTYLINGLASSVEIIGYGFTNLSKKIPNHPSRLIHPTGHRRRLI